MKKAFYAPMLALMGVFGLLSNILSTVAYRSFAYFELFYFLCLALGIFLLLSRRQEHFIGGILLVTLGYFVNCFFWSVRMASGFAQILNFLLTALILLSGIFLLHAYLGNARAKRIAPILSLLLSLLILFVAIYNLATGLSSANTPFLNVCVVFQNLSLLSTALLGGIQFHFVKETH